MGANSVVASIPIGSGSAIGDTAITPDQTLGFVTNFANGVWVVDLTTSPPSLAAGTNPIPISNFGEELSVTPDGKFLLASDGSALQPISVIDIASRAEISTFSTGTDINSHDTCDDGTTVLVTSSRARNLRRLVLDPVTGTLTGTTDVLSLPAFAEPNNVHCAPGSSTGVVVTRFEGAVRSFTIPDLSLVDTRTLADFGISAVFSPGGERVFVRSTSFSGPGAVEAFTYDVATGLLGATPDDSVSVAAANTFFGMDQLGISGGGDALYVPEGSPINAVTILDAADLMAMPLGSITDPGIVQPTGVSLPRFVPFEDFAVVLELDYDGFELDGEFTLGASSNGIDPTTEDVTLKIGSYTVTIPAGSFKADNGGFDFEGVIDGVDLDIEIELIWDGTYSIQADGKGVDLSGESEPVTVVLTIGDDGGGTIAVPENY